MQAQFEYLMHHLQIWLPSISNILIGSYDSFTIIMHAASCVENSWTSSFNLQLMTHNYQSCAFVQK